MRIKSVEVRDAPGRSKAKTSLVMPILLIAIGALFLFRNCTRDLNHSSFLGPIGN